MSKGFPSRVLETLIRSKICAWGGEGLELEQPREAVGALSLEVSKVRLEGA